MSDQSRFHLADTETTYNPVGEELLEAFISFSIGDDSPDDILQGCLEVRRVSRVQQDYLTLPFLDQTMMESI